MGAIYICVYLHVTRLTIVCQGKSKPIYIFHFTLSLIRRFYARYYLSHSRNIVPNNRTNSVMVICSNLDDLFPFLLIHHALVLYGGFTKENTSRLVVFPSCRFSIVIRIVEDRFISILRRLSCDKFKNWRAIDTVKWTTLFHILHSLLPPAT